MLAQSSSKGDFERVLKAQSRKIRPSTGFAMPPERSGGQRDCALGIRP